jgi:hypothetical protein
VASKSHRPLTIPAYFALWWLSVFSWRPLGDGLKTRDVIPIHGHGLFHFTCMPQLDHFNLCNPISNLITDIDEDINTLVPGADATVT